MNWLISIMCLAVSLKLTIAQTCDPVEFECDNGRCVHGSFICDGDNDCGDMSDERDANGTCPTCPSQLFQCTNGKCTFAQYICDGDNDCGDGSDEEDENGNCPDCPVGSFKCAFTGKCLVPRDLCDGYNDCGDWSDGSEETCPCSDNEMRCTPKNGEEDGPPGQCIPEKWVCDPEGIWDCPNGDDEANCTLAKTTHVKGHRFRPIKIHSKKILKAKSTRKFLRSKNTKYFWYNGKKNYRN